MVINLAKKMSVFCFQILILIAIYQMGNYVERYFRLKIPGNVIGMLMLFALLWLRVIKIDQIQDASNWLLKHLGFFFIPISVGLMTIGSTLIHQGIAILFVLSISALLGIVSAGKAAQIFINRRKEGNAKYHDHSV